MRKWGLLLLVCALGLSACKFAGGEGPAYEEPDEGTLIYASLNPLTANIRKYVDYFNKNHEDVQIEVRDYSDEGGPQRLLLELMAGIVPDILELHQVGKSGELSYPYVHPLIFHPARVDRTEDGSWLPYRQLVQKGYLEDLWPYIKNDPRLSKEVMEAPLKAAEVDGGLYMLFHDFYITTLIGDVQVVGDRCGWTFDELMDAFSTMPPDSTILPYNATQRDIFSELLRFTLDQYVDWENCESLFDCEDFRSLLQFLKSFPSEFESSLTAEEIEKERVWRMVDGYQMLEPIHVYNLPYGRLLYGKKAAFVGYPTADGSSGSFVVPHGSKLAMTSTCRNKEAAWDFLRLLIRNSLNPNTILDTCRNHLILLPVNRKDYDLKNDGEMKRSEWEMAHTTYAFKGPTFPYPLPTEEDVQRLDTLIEKTTRLYWPDNDLSDIVWDTIGPYLAGDKTMDETIRLLDNRVTLYVNELR